MPAFNLLEMLLAIMLLGFIGWQASHAAKDNDIIITPTQVTLQAETMLQKIFDEHRTTGGFSLPPPHRIGDYKIELVAVNLQGNFHRIEANVVLGNEIISRLILII